MKEIIEAVEKRFGVDAVMCIYPDMSGRFEDDVTGSNLFSFDNFSELTVEKVLSGIIDPENWIVL